MLKIKLSIIFLLFISSFTLSNAYFYNEYYWESISAFIDSPSSKDLKYIDNEVNMYCETVYLVATRRREYTDIEIAICSDIFDIKKQQELDYIMYMYKNRWIY